jgi:hypothetical protein
MLRACPCERAQSAPAPVLISEGYPQLGIYDNSVFQHTAQNVVALQVEGGNEGGELPLLLSPKPITLRASPDSPFIVRLYLAYRQYTEGEETLAIFLDLLGGGDQDSFFNFGEPGTRGWFKEQHPSYRSWRYRWNLSG